MTTAFRWVVIGIVVGSVGCPGEEVTLRQAGPGVRPIEPGLLSTADRERLAEGGLRVLLPADPLPPLDVTYTAAPGWYTASIRLAGHTVVVEGTRHQVADSDLPPLEEPTRASPRIGRNERIAEATFLEQGVSYTVGVECEAPFEDPRCTEDSYLRSLLASLRPVVLTGTP